MVELVAAFGFGPRKLRLLRDAYVPTFNVAGFEAGWTPPAVCSCRTRCVCRGI